MVSIAGTESPGPFIEALDLGDPVTVEFDFRADRILHPSLFVSNVPFKGLCIFLLMLKFLGRFETSINKVGLHRKPCDPVVPVRMRVHSWANVAF